jgi:hypothetical protein
MEEILGYMLQQTCSACPEQYDVFKNSVQVGYLRLRHGFFYADVPNCGGTTVYESDTIGDGCFDDDEERAFHLTNAIVAIDAELQK